LKKTNQFVLFPPSSDGRGPQLKFNGKWISLDALDVGTVQRLAVIEEKLNELNKNNDQYITAVAWNLRVVQHAYYTARSMGIQHHYIGCRSLPGKITPEIENVYFPENDPIHAFVAARNIYPALYLAIQGFYHTAFRIVDLLRRDECCLPRIKPLGVIQVCNRIVKHSEPGKNSFTLGGKAFTLQLNAGAALSDGFSDVGAAENCNEFLDEIERALVAI